VADASISEFAEEGLGLEPGNLAALRSMRLFRTLRWGKNVELMLTDNRTFRSEPVMDQAGATAFQTKGFPYVSSQEVVEILDAGRAYNGGRPPETIRFNGADVPNPRKDAAPQSMLGNEQKAWFLARLRESKTPWKLWGNSVAMLDWRMDFQNLPAGNGPQWPSKGYAQFADDDWSGYVHERTEILEFVRREKIAGFVTICGDRHSFQAGVLSGSLQPKEFHPVAAEFVTGSISAPGLFEAAEFGMPKEHPLRPIFVYQPSPEKPAQAAVNFSVMHGVRATLALQKTGDVRKALAERNPEASPHLSFVDGGGHGYAVVRAGAEELEVEFVCIPRPIERTDAKDGGPLAYRVAHRVKHWRPGEAPKLERTVAEGALPLVV